MSNPKVWSPNLTFDAVPGSLALDTLDLYVSQSINGVTGGVEAPVAPIIIGGAGLQVTGAFTAVASTFDGPVTFTTNGDITLNSGCVLTAQSGSSLVNQGTFTTTTSLNFALAKTYTRGPKGIFAVTISATQWLMPTTAGVFNAAYAQGTDVTTGSPILWIMNVPPGATITGASLWVDPPAGHGGVLPNTVPRFTLFTYNADTAAITTVPGSATSDPTAIGTYEDAHEFASGVLSTTVGANHYVVMEVWGEYGGSAVAGLKAFAPSVTFTRTRIGEE